jgi:hypothetical protein
LHCFSDHFGLDAAEFRGFCEQPSDWTNRTASKKARESFCRAATNLDASVRVDKFHFFRSFGARQFTGRRCSSFLGSACFPVFCVLKGGGGCV